MVLQRIWIPLLFSGVSIAGVERVWLEPRTPVALTVGEAKPYAVIGLYEGGVRADLTKSPDLHVTSSDDGVLEIDPEHGTFIGKKPGHVDVRISFSRAAAMIPAFVRAPKTATAEAQKISAMDGVWKAVFTGDQGARPKMVDEIVFALDSSGDLLTGTVHAAYWPGDAAVSDGRVDGNRVSFTMTGHLPYSAGRPGAIVTGYPKLCFTGIRDGDQMKIDLLWTDARNPCDEGHLLPMAAKKVGD